MVRFSNFDLIKILMKNSRIPFTQIAKNFGVTETSIRKRIKKLLDDKIIKRFTIDVDLKALGLNTSLIGIDVKPEFYTDVITELKNNSKIKKLYTSTGDHMLMLEFWFKSNIELRNFTKKIKNINGVTRVCPAILLERIK